MVVHLKQLEKALEAGIAEGSLKENDAIIDEYLNENESISASASAKLHEALFRLWTSEALMKSEEDTNVLTPQSTRTVDSAVSNALDSNMAQFNRGRVVFLQALVRLAPCIIETDKLLVWWDELSVYAIDSTGHRLEIVELSQKFLMGVLTESFHAHGDPAISELALESALAYGRKTLELFVSGKLPKMSVGEATDERVRYVRQNCRICFGHFGRRETKPAFTLLNEFFVKREYRLDILNLVVEYFSQSQNSKLFRVYETPFFESLLRCLEHDKTADVLQLALTALAMLIVHVCDKLVPTGLLFRILACFGRVCSWQYDTTSSESMETGFSDDNNDDEEDTEFYGRRDDDQDIEELKDHQKLGSTDLSKTSKTASNTANSDPVKSPATTTASHARTASKESSIDPSTQSEATSDSDSTSAWQVLYDEAGVDPDQQPELTIDVLPLFTFLYGLFPQNALLFARQCDEYLSKHGYQRAFSDFWSRFMVTKKVESLVREFRIDPLLLVSTPETELSGSVLRFQSIGSATGITSIITSRLVSQPIDGDVDKAIEEHQRSFQALMQTGTASQSDTAAQATSVPGSPVVANAGGVNSPRTSEISTSYSAADGAQRSAAYWQRELRLLRNELAFTEFRRQMSEQRALRWQKRAAKWAIAELKKEELSRQIQVLESKAGVLQEETQRALRSARTIMRERSAYETKILDRNRDFRDQITKLENKVLELQLDAEGARQAERSLSDLLKANEERAGHAEIQLKALRNDVEASKREGLGALENVVDPAETIAVQTVEDDRAMELRFEIESLKKERDAAVEIMSREVAAAQKQAASQARELRRSRGKNASGDRDQEPFELVARENQATVARLKSANEELLHRCLSVEHELRARKIHEEERMNELQAALMSARAFAPMEPQAEGRFRGRGGAQGVPRRA